MVKRSSMDCGWTHAACKNVSKQILCVLHLPRNSRTLALERFAATAAARLAHESTGEQFGPRCCSGRGTATYSMQPAHTQSREDTVLYLYSLRFHLPWPCEDPVPLSKAAALRFSKLRFSSACKLF